MKIKSAREKRKHKRFPTISLIKEIVIEAPSIDIEDSVPAIMFNLSAGGIAIITFVDVPEKSMINIKFNLPGLKLDNIEGEIVRVEKKRSTYLIAISFRNIKKSLQDKIRRIANDFDICKTRILRGEKKICFKECGYYKMCTKSIKIKKK